MVRAGDLAEGAGTVLKGLDGVDNIELTNAHSRVAPHAGLMFTALVMDGTGSSPSPGWAGPRARFTPSVTCAWTVEDAGEQLGERCQLVSWCSACCWIHCSTAKFGAIWSQCITSKQGIVSATCSRGWIGRDSGSLRPEHAVGFASTQIRNRCP
jgi:hypothetical protein